MQSAFDSKDLLLHERITELNCVPNLDLAAVTVQNVDATSDSTQSAIWSYPLDHTGSPRQLTSGIALDTCPRWSPDGSVLAFISTRQGGLQQIFLMPRDGGETRQLTSFVNGLMAMDWHPDGDRLLAIASISVNPEDRGGRPEDDAGQRSPDAPRVAWRLPYKQDGGGISWTGSFISLRWTRRAAKHGNSVTVRSTS